MANMCITDAQHRWVLRKCKGKLQWPSMTQLIESLSLKGDQTTHWQEREATEILTRGK